VAKSLAVAMIESMRAERPDLVLEIVDITGRPEVAVKYRVMARPPSQSTADWPSPPSPVRLIFAAPSSQRCPREFPDRRVP